MSTAKEELFDDSGSTNNGSSSDTNTPKKLSKNQRKKLNQKLRAQSENKGSDTSPPSEEEEQKLQAEERDLDTQGAQSHTAPNTAASAVAASATNTTSNSTGSLQVPIPELENTQSLGMAKWQSMAQKLMTALETANANIRRLEQQQSVSAGVSELQSQRDALEARNRELESDNIRLRQQNELYENIRRGQGGFFTDIMASQEAAERHRREHERLLELERTSVQSNIRMRELETANQQLTADAERNLKEAGELRNQIQTLNERVTPVDQLNERLAAEMAQLREQLRQAQQQLQQSQTQLAGVRLQLEQAQGAQAQLAQLQQQLQQAQAAHTQAVQAQQQSQQAAEATRAQLEAQLAQLQQQLQQAQAARAQLEAQLAQLQQQLQALQGGLQQQPVQVVAQQLNPIPQPNGGNGQGAVPRLLLREQARQLQQQRIEAARLQGINARNQQQPPVVQQQPSVTQQPQPQSLESALRPICVRHNV